MGGSLGSLRFEVARLTENTSVPRWHDRSDAHTHIQLELLGRYLAGKAVIGAVKADEPASIPGSSPGALIKLFIDVTSAAFCTTRWAPSVGGFCPVSE